MPKIKLKPCPFCGKKPKSQLNITHPGSIIACMTKGCEIALVGCGSQKPRFDLMPDEAISAWNKRVNDDKGWEDVADICNKIIKE